MGEIYANDRRLVVPKVYSALTTNRVLTMERMYGAKARCLDSLSVSMLTRDVKINDTAALKKMGLRQDKVARLLLDVFADQIYAKGFVHCDPHPGVFVPHVRAAVFLKHVAGNIMVRVQNGRPQIVLLDHGLYVTLDKAFRYAAFSHDRSLLTFCGEQTGLRRAVSCGPVPGSHSIRGGDREDGHAAARRRGPGAAVCAGDAPDGRQGFVAGAPCRVAQACAGMPISHAGVPISWPVDDGREPAFLDDYYFFNAERNAYSYANQVHSRVCTGEIGIS